MLQWIVYYGDGSECTSEVAVQDVPARDVQVIVQVDRDAGWAAAMGADYYIWRDNRWWGVDQAGYWDYMFEPGWKKVLFGRIINTNEFDAIVARAMEDTRLPKKTSKARGER